MNLREKLGFAALVIFTFGMLFIAFWMLELMERGSLSGWAGHPIGIICILLALLGAEVIKDYPN